MNSIPLRDAWNVTLLPLPMTRGALAPSDLAPPALPLLHLAASANELPKEQPEGEPYHKDARAVHNQYADCCRYVFLDVGSNIGNHVRFLYEAEKFPGSQNLQRDLPG